MERKNPYIARFQEIEIGEGKKSILVHGRAANKPFGLIGHQKKIELGMAIRRLIEKSRPK